MKLTILFFCGCCLFVFAPQSEVLGQQELTPYTGEVESEECLGYIVSIPLEEERIKKYFWKFSSHFGMVSNERSFYKMTLPIEDQRYTVKMNLYGIVRDDEAEYSQTGGEFSLCMKSSDAHPSRIESYLGEVETFLKTFLTYTERMRINQRISELENEFNRTSSDYIRKSKNFAYEDELQECLKRMHTLQLQIFELRYPTPD